MKGVSNAIQYSRNIRPLTAYLRDVIHEEGSRNCYKLRKKEQMIPGVIYGGNPFLNISSHNPDSKIYVKTPIRNLQREIDRYHRTFESRVYDLTIYPTSSHDNMIQEPGEGMVHRVTPHNLQRHPVHDTVYYCVNFLRYHPERPLQIPITYINEEESAALKRDGFIVPIQRYVECLIEDNVDIPEKIELECTGLNYKDVIRTDRFIVPDGVRLSDRVMKKGKEFIVGVVFGKSRGAIAKEEEEKAAATTASAGKKK
jgi:Ribosomal protein TL5, C-terminal domain/Ribosomal L25p family